MSLKKSFEFLDQIDSIGPEGVLAVLEPMLTEERKLKINEVLDQRISSIQVAVESPHDIYNALAIIRTAEAFGVQYVHVLDWQGEKRKSVRTTMGTHRWTDLHYHKSLEAFSSSIAPYQVVGACVEGGKPLDQINLEQPICLLFGNEHDGLTPEALDRCHERFTIPMFGMVESLNLSVAAAITLHQVTQKKRETLGGHGDLKPEQKALERAWYTYRCIGAQKAQAILTRSKRDTEG